MRVGDELRLTCSIYEQATGDTPGGYCGLKGDLVIVRKIGKGQWPLMVSHAGREGGFWVGENEVTSPEGEA